MVQHLHRFAELLQELAACLLCKRAHAAKCLSQLRGNGAVRKRSRGVRGRHCKLPVCSPTSTAASCHGHSERTNSVSAACPVQRKCKDAFVLFFQRLQSDMQAIAKASERDCQPILPQAARLSKEHCADLVSKHAESQRQVRATVPG